MPSNRSSRPAAGASAKKAPPRAAKAANKPVAAAARRRGGPAAADATEAKHRRAAEMLRQLRDDVDALSANADRLLGRFPL